MTTASDTVEISVRGHVGEIRFANPPINFATLPLLRMVGDAIEELDANPDVRCTLLTSVGKNFCAGADLKEGESSAEGDTGVGVIRAFYGQAERLFRRRKPMVAAVQGAAIGAGLGLALVADFRIASPDARLSANFVRLGFHPGFGLTYTLPRLVGAQKAAWMMLSAERVKAGPALEWGLIDRIAGEGELLADAEKMANEIAENAPLALMEVHDTLCGATADNVRKAMEHELSRQAVLRETADYAEGVASVFERRDANFIGR